MNKREKSIIPPTTPRYSATFSNDVNSDIRRAAATGIYDIRGGGAKRKLPTFDDLLFLGASISRYPLEGYREKCETNVRIGTRYAKNPIELDIPITFFILISDPDDMIPAPDCISYCPYIDLVLVPSADVYTNVPGFGEDGPDP